MGTLYHERQESKLCALHCVNAVLQGPAFSEFDLAAMASDLDHAERQMMLDSVSGDFLPEVSHNVSRNGDFSIQVLTKALEVWDLQIIPLDNPVAQAAQINPDVENAYICHLRNHWFLSEESGRRVVTISTACTPRPSTSPSFTSQPTSTR
ncbi:ataxin-3 homolog [Phtheirospermum japonicum]|uniref:ubiquitinyl hydrolase 1 n=1 Tax=Phtheirospermum japonicum TaxID=374723 RepID=A0A830BMN0_9LAMI|nr:ataxin-3 homolog [Phtheirospermum japonicum]